MVRKLASIWDFEDKKLVLSYFGKSLRSQFGIQVSMAMKYVRFVIYHISHLLATWAHSCSRTHFFLSNLLRENR